MSNKKMILHFTLLTFIIAYSTSGLLIILGQYGYKVYNWVNTLQQFIMNIPFAIYILSPAIASFAILKKHNKITDIKEWLKTVFYAKNSLYAYLYVIAILTLYFLIHMFVTGNTKIALPFDTFFLSLPGCLMIGGLEESGWMYILQPEFNKKYGYILSSIYTGIIWFFWHIPLFFIPGTNHGDGLINFWMFAVQVISFRFLIGAIYKISGKGCIFMCVLFHTMFNAASPLFGTMTMTWLGTIIANIIIVLISIVTVIIHNQRHEQLTK